MAHQNVPVEILNAVSSILRSDETARVWAKHNASRANDNPALSIAQRIDSLASNPDSAERLEADAELLSFMRSLIETERKASKGNKEVFKALDLAAGILRDALPDSQRIRDEKLSQDYQDVLKTFSRQTLQRFKPWQDTKSAVKHLTEHFGDIVKAAPIRSSAVAAIIVPAIAYLMFEGMSAKNAPVQLESQETCMTNLSASNVFGQSNFDAGYNEETCTPDFKECHDNLKSTFPNAVGYLESRGIEVLDIPHCTLVNNLSQATQGGLLKADEVLKGPYYAVMDLIVDRPLDAANDFSLFEDSHFIDGAEKVAKPLQDFIYYINRIENSLHPVLFLIMFAYGFRGVFHAKQMNGEEWKEFKDSIIDFTAKAGQTRAMNFIIPALSVATYLNTHGYDSSGSFVDSNIVGLSVIGALTGYMSHKIGAKLTGLNARHAKRVCEDLTKQLETLDTASLPLTEQKKLPDPERRAKTLRRVGLYGSAASIYGSVVTADLSGFIDSMPDGAMKDMAVQMAEAAGMLPVAAGILGGFIPYNFTIEDPAQHSVFIGGGVATGTAVGLAALTAYMAAKYGAKYANKFKRELIAMTTATGLTISPAQAANDFHDAVVIAHRPEEMDYEELFTPSGP